MSKTSEFFVEMVSKLSQNFQKVKNWSILGGGGDKNKEGVLREQKAKQWN